MVSRIQWKPFWLVTQFYPHNDWTGWQNVWNVTYSHFPHGKVLTKFGNVLCAVGHDIDIGARYACEQTQEIMRVPLVMILAWCVIERKFLTKHWKRCEFRCLQYWLEIRDCNSFFQTIPGVVTSAAIRHWLRYEIESIWPSFEVVVSAAGHNIGAKYVIKRKFFKGIDCLVEMLRVLLVMILMWDMRYHCIMHAPEVVIQLQNDLGRYHARTT